MYAVIKTGGKQYKVEKGATLRVEKLDVETGKSIDFTEVLLVADGDKITVGTPVVAGAKVSAEILGQEKGEKLIIFKFRRRKAYRKKTGHRQTYTALKITDISTRA
jgi:large subunit ribosomal protein L21